MTMAVAVNLLMLSVENAHPRWAAEALVIAARARPDTLIVADAETYHRALMPMRWNHLTRVGRGPPKPGDLLFLPDEHVPAGAIVVARYPSPRTALGAVLDEMGVGDLVPYWASRRLRSPNPTALLVRPDPDAPAR